MVSVREIWCILADKNLDHPMTTPLVSQEEVVAQESSRHQIFGKRKVQKELGLFDQQHVNF